MKRLLLLNVITLTLTSCSNLTPAQNDALTRAGDTILQAGAQRIAGKINPQK